MFFVNWHAACNCPCMTAEMVRIGQVQGDKTMTNTTNLTRNAMASVFALFASWVAISAAIGPVLPTIA